MAATTLLTVPNLRKCADELEDPHGDRSDERDEPQYADVASTDPPTHDALVEEPVDRPVAPPETADLKEEPAASVETTASKTALNDNWFSQNIKKNLGTLVTIAATILACTLVTRAMKQDSPALSVELGSEQPTALQHDLILQSQPETTSEVVETIPDFDPSQFDRSHLVATGPQTTPDAQPTHEQPFFGSPESNGFVGSEFDPLPTDRQTVVQSDPNPRSATTQFPNEGRGPTNYVPQREPRDAYSREAAVEQPASPFAQQSYEQPQSAPPVDTQLAHPPSRRPSGMSLDGPEQLMNQRTLAPTAVVPSDVWPPEALNRAGLPSGPQVEQTRAANEARPPRTGLSSTFPASRSTAHVGAQAGQYPSTGGAFPPLRELGDPQIQRMVEREGMRMVDQRATGVEPKARFEQQPSRYDAGNQQSYRGVIR